MGIDTTAFLQLAEAIVSQPTAPFHEDAVRAEIARQLTPCKSIHLGEDRFGNLIARYQRGKKSPTLAFAAHMDHPGYVGREFLGGVPKAYLKKNAPLEKFGTF